MSRHDCPNCNCPRPEPPANGPALDELIQVHVQGHWLNARVTSPAEGGEGVGQIFAYSMVGCSVGGAFHVGDEGKAWRRA